MSSAVCVSLVANLRCSGLRPQQAIVILVPVAVEAFFISFLIYTQWKKGRKHFLLIFDSYIFLSLCVVDFVSKTSDAISTSIAVFSVVDRVIGGLSGFPIVLYTLFLYLFSRQHFISIFPTRFHWSFNVLLTLLIPVILILVELGSLLGFSYITLPGPPSELAVRYNTPLSKTLWTLLNSAGLVLLALYQAVCFCLAIFRVFRYFTHATSDSPRIIAMDSKSSKRNRQNMRMRGVGWIAAGIKLGAIEVLLGFIPNGFGMALSRRLFRVVSRLMLAWGVYQGIDETPGSTMFRVGSIDSIEGLPPRRIPVNQSGGLRTLISAPMTETFAKMSPTATAFHTRKKVPDAMSGLRNFDMSFVDEEGGPTGDAAIIPPMVQSISAPSLSAAGSGPVASASFASGGNSSRNGQGSVYPERPTFLEHRRGEKRVTLAYNGLQAPVLDIRFSAQVFPDARKLINGFGRHSPAGSIPSGEDAGSQRPALTRSRTSPAATISSRPTRLEHTAEDMGNYQMGVALATAKIPPVNTPTAAKDLLPMTRTANSGNRGRSRSTSHKSAQTTLYNPFADPSDLNHSFSSSQETSSKTRREGSPLSDDSLTAIRQISTQFPPLPFGSGPGLTSESPTRSLLRKPILDGRSGSAILERTSPARQRSYSSPRLGNEVGVEEQMLSPRRIIMQNFSPRASLDQDVATRTKRRIHAHLKNVSSSSSLSGLGEAQWAGGQAVSAGRGGPHMSQSASSSPNRTTTTSAATSLFSTRGRAIRGTYTKYTGGGRADLAEDMLTSPTTAFTDSVYSVDDMSLRPLPADRPIGRIARRALGIEQFLGEEKEKKGASQDGHGDPIQPSGLAQPISATNASFEDPIPVPSTSRVRPRSNVDASPVALRIPKRNMTVDDPGARQAFATAWRTVVPTISSPSVGDLKNVSSVRVKRTPAPSRRRAVFSGESMQSMRVDEIHSGSLSPVFLSMPPQRAIMGSGTGQAREPGESDRGFVRKVRLAKVPSVDSEVH